MNTLSVRKLHELLYTQRHRMAELYVSRGQIQYILAFCEHYRNFFMIDLRTLPMVYDDDKAQELAVTTMHPTTLPGVERDLITSMYAFQSGRDHHQLPEYITSSLQKERMDRIPFHVNSYLKLAYYGCTYLMHLDATFQLEHVRYPERFAVYCVSVDDYYIHQSTLSHDLFKRYEQLCEFISTNVARQSNILMALFKNQQVIQENMKRTLQTLEKYQRYVHITSSLFQRAMETKRWNMVNAIIEVMYSIHRAQLEYILQTEDKFYTMTLHSQRIIDVLTTTSSCPT